MNIGEFSVLSLNYIKNPVSIDISIHIICDCMYTHFYCNDYIFHDSFYRIHFTRQQLSEIFFYRRQRVNCHFITVTVNVPFVKWF